MHRPETQGPLTMQQDFLPLVTNVSNFQYDLKTEMCRSVSNIITSQCRRYFTVSPIQIHGHSKTLNYSEFG